MLVDIVDCTGRLLEGQKKYCTFIWSLFLPLLERLDRLKERTDIALFDGESNFQLAGRSMQAVYPRITVLHRLEHVLSLVFEDIAKIEVVKVSLLCAVFIICPRVNSPLCQVVDTTGEKIVSCVGSGSNHKPYAFFIGHSKQYNKGQAVGLL